jgi:hypothetical protein
MKRMRRISTITQILLSRKKGKSNKKRLNTIIKRETRVSINNKKKKFKSICLRVTNKKAFKTTNMMKIVFLMIKYFKIVKSKTIKCRIRKKWVFKTANSKIAGNLIERRKIIKAMIIRVR